MPRECSGLARVIALWGLDRLWGDSIMGVLDWESDLWCHTDDASQIGFNLTSVRHWLSCSENLRRRFAAWRNLSTD